MGEVEIDLGRFETVLPSQARSPFRYPGGKSFLTGYFKHRLSTRPNLTVYSEPFCGGAGAAVNLLLDEAVEEVRINDFDVRVYSAWRAIVSENQRFIQQIRDVELTVDVWERASQLVNSHRQRKYSFDLGFATFLLNRTSRSGIVLGSGPIGGYSQSGKWRLDARFYRDTLCKRVNDIGKARKRVKVSNFDAVTFLKRQVRLGMNEQTLFFVDPPYVKAGERLYLNAMSDAKHIELAALLQSGQIENWILTYDNHPLIHDAYSASEVQRLKVNYSLQNRRKATEIFIESMTVPSTS